MHRPIPGARFFASVLGVASLFGGATALADAGRLGVTHIVDLPAAPAAAVLAEATAAKASDTLVKEADKAVAFALSGLAEAESADAGQADLAPVLALASTEPRLPRLRPQPTDADTTAEAEG